MAPTVGVTPVKVSRARVLAITAGGSVLEYYDYALYGLAAALVFNTQFFPGVSPGVGVILSLATFASGSLVKPLGSLVFSHFGDRLGRARVLFATMILLGVSTTAIGLLPTYAQIGALAPVCLLALRLVQGFAAGAEMPGSAIFGLEAAPAGKRGLYASFTSFGSGIGATLAVLVFMLISALGGAEVLAAWAWRVPFLFGVVILIFVYFARRGISDMEKHAYATSEGIAEVPLKEVFRNYRRSFLGSLGVATGYTACSGIAAVYFLTYMKANGFSSTDTLTAQLIFQILIIPLVPLVAIFSDRTNRKVVLTLGAVATALSFVLFFTFVPSASMTVVCVLISVVAITISLMYGGLLGFLAEQFPRHVRYTGMGVAFAVGSAIGGGLSPVVAASVMEISGQSRAAMSLLGVGIAVLVAVATLALRNHSSTGNEQLDEVTAAPSDAVARAQKPGPASAIVAD
ncbi:MFS transporter [Saccharopolyspora sp. ASAGF58]|uniref:MFS transporter n=1 Tax=Saccharopolyspora sp. ASAGF58 TaxID=2719023 RepID=UPI001447F980|nr:MFS transporter [Saccharopolyspora sp. ASAGF58]